MKMLCIHMSAECCKLRNFSIPWGIAKSITWFMRPDRSQHINNCYNIFEIKIKDKIKENFSSRVGRGYKAREGSSEVRFPKPLDCQ
jgi:hypothetical protein